MENLKVQMNKNDSDQRRAVDDSDDESLLSENELLFGFLFPHALKAGHLNGASD